MWNDQMHWRKLLLSMLFRIHDFQLRLSVSLLLGAILASQCNAQSPTRAGILEDSRKLVERDWKRTDPDSFVPRARLICEELKARNRTEAEKILPRLCKDIEELPDQPFEWYCYSSFSEAVGLFESAGCDSDAQKLLAACFNKLARCTKDPEMPVSIDVHFFISKPGRSEAVNELWWHTIEKIQGPNSRCTAFVCDRRSEKLINEGHLAEAMPLIERCAAILQAQASHLDTEVIKAGCYAIASRGLDFAHHDDEASEEKAYRISMKLCDTLDPKLVCRPINARMWLARLLDRQGKTEVAYTLVKQVAIETIEHLQPRKKYLASTVQDLINDCILLDDLEPAEWVLDKIVSYSQMPALDDSEIERVLCRAFEYLDNSDLAWKTYQKAIACHDPSWQGPTFIKADEVWKERLLELKKKHVDMMVWHSKSKGNAAEP